MNWMTEISVPGTSLILPTIDDLGLSDKELLGMGIIILVPVACGIIILSFISLKKHLFRNHKNK
jgi:hypothetical protein